MLPKSNPTTIYSERKNPFGIKTEQSICGAHMLIMALIWKRECTQNNTQNTTILGYKSKAGSICATSQLQTIHKSKKFFLTP